MIEEINNDTSNTLPVMTEQISIPVSTEELEKKIQKYEEEKISEIKLSLRNAITIFKELIMQYNAQDKPYDDTERQLSIDMGNLIKIYNKITDEDFEE